MAGWVALLRGINLGPHKRIAMADLRRVYEEAGCASVRTYIASGNVLFEHGQTDRRKLAGALEQAVAAELGVSSMVVLRSFRELRELVRSHPFGEDTSQTYVTFLPERPPAAAVRALRALDVEPDELVVAGSDVFIRHPNGLANARISGVQLDRALGVPGTNRNWRTVAKLAGLSRS
jgi:uncharacterized protein (DUF1697 family)